MGYIDLHCDTLMVYAGKNGSLSENRMAIDIGKLKKGECTAQFFAIWMPDAYGRREMGLLPEYIGAGSGRWGLEPGAEPASELQKSMSEEEWDDCYYERLEAGFYQTLKDRHEEIAFAGSLADLKANEAAGKISAFLTLEDGRSVRGDMARLEAYFKRGIRLISLTWNHDNCFGMANYKDAPFGTKGGGLSSFGKDAVIRMNELGMMIDVSHLSDEGFYDVADISEKPFVASHSNARAVAECSRNMSDKMIRMLAEKGGVMGLNFAPGFLKTGSTESRAEWMVLHLKHILNVGGEEVLSLGSDLDGIGGNLEVSSPDKLWILWEEMRKAGFTERQMDLMMRKNAERVIGDILR